MRNAWLESQTPEARAAEMLKRDIAKKQEILANKRNMVKLLDLDKAVVKDGEKPIEEIVSPTMPQLGEKIKVKI